MVGIQSFPFGAWPIFRGEMAVSFREGLAFAAVAAYHDDPRVVLISLPFSFQWSWLKLIRRFYTKMKPSYLNCFQHYRHIMSCVHFPPPRHCLHQHQRYETQTYPAERASGGSVGWYQSHQSKSSRSCVESTATLQFNKKLAYKKKLRYNFNKIHSNLQTNRKHGIECNLKTIQSWWKQSLYPLSRTL